MPRIESIVSPLNAIAAAVMVVLSLLMPPGVYCIVEYSTLVAAMQSQAQLDATAINIEIINKLPQLWTFQEMRLKELMSHRLSDGTLDNQFLRIVDSNNEVVAAVGNPKPWPVIVESRPLFDAGQRVGRLEIQRSLRPMFFNAAWLSLFGLALAMGSFVSLRVLPLRAVLKANEALRLRTEELLREIEERQRTQAALQESGQVIEAVLNSVPARIFWKDKNLIYLGCNAAFARDAGFTHPKDVVGKDDYQMGWRDQAELYRGDDRRVIESGLPKLLIDEPQTTPEGKVITLLTSKIPLRSSNGEAAGVLGMYMDVTERAQLQAQLAYSNLLNTAALENAPDGILVVDQNGTIVSFNRQFTKMWNIPQELVSKKNDAPILQAVASQVADEKEFIARVKYLYEHPDDKGHEELKLKDGRVFERHSGSLRDASQKYLGRIWFFRDISDRERAREALAKNEEKYRNLVESTTDVIWEIDRNGRYTYVSPTVKVLIGFEAQELIGKTPFDLMPSAEAQRVANIFQPLAAARQPFSAVENINLRKDGTEVVLESSGVPIFDDGGVWQGYRGIDRDITERKLTADKLQQRDALLHAVAVSATEFLTAPSLDEAMRRTLELVSKTIRVERITVLESGAARLSAPILRYIWQAPDIAVSIDARFFENPRLITPEIAEWLTAGSEGKIVLSNLRTASSGVKLLLQGVGIKTVLFVPIMIDGKHWGQIGIDSCKAERSWEDFEIEILRTLAELIGNAIQRERYVREIANANRIVQNTPTILYRMRGEPSLPMIYISQNIKLFGHEPAALMASPNLYQSLIHADDIARVRSTMAATMENGESRGVNEFRLLTSRGEYRWVENRYTLIRDSVNRLIEIEGLLFDVTERKAAEEKIAKLARTDALTGLPNRSTFIERLQQTFAAARRGASSFAVFYLDIDHFKDINDTLGHPIGDSVLIKVGECIRDSVRETDLVARFGGDEFAILQADLADSSDAGSLAVKIRAALAVPIQLGGSMIRMTASIGIATYAPEVSKPEDMLAQADVALYRAKEEGRDQYRFHSEALDIEVRERVALAEELRQAVDLEELELYYQPQVELSTGQIVGMEALIRWNHPTRGLLLPAAFLAVAEKTGSIAAIGRWVLDRACRQMSLWRKDGIAPPTLAVNISLTQVSAANEFIQLVTETLAKWSLAATDLEFDVTESMLARATLAQNDVLERLHKLGVRIAIDDFGTKFSTLDYLKIYRVNRLKIPHALIAAAAKDAESAAVVRAIAGIARELNIDVVAQGVETEAQWSYLTATSPATKVQGFFYSEPVPAGRAKDLLEVGYINAPEKHRALTAPKHQ